MKSVKVSRKGLVLEHKSKTGTIVVPRLLNLSERGGFAIDFWVNFRELSVGQVIFESRTESGKGIDLATSDRFTMMLTLNDGAREFSCESDPGTHPGTLRVNAWQYIAVIVDAGPRIVSFVIDGEFNDGGSARQFGWSRFPKELATSMAPANRAHSIASAGRVGGSTPLQSLSPDVGVYRRLSRRPNRLK